MTFKMPLLDRTIAYFRGFWALVEDGQSDIEELKPEQILSSFSDFWTMVALGGDESDGLEQGDVDSGPETGSEDEDSPAEDFSAMQHFAKMFILEADQRYLYRTLQINDNILQDQEMKLKEVRKAVKSRELELKQLVRARQKRETVLNHKILGSFTQFWSGIEKQEITGSGESDHLEYAGDFFHLAH